MNANAVPQKASLDSGQDGQVPEADGDRVDASAAESSELSSHTLNLLAVATAVVLVVGGITIEQINRHQPAEELARPELREDHIVNLRPETEGVLPETFIEKIALCRETTLESNNTLLTGTHGYSCKPWLTKQEDAEGLTTFHSPRSVVLGDEAAALVAALPTHHDPTFQTSTRTVRDAQGDQPAVFVNAWESGDVGGGDIYVYYPEDEVLITWPWNKTDPGADDVEAVVSGEGF